MGRSAQERVKPIQQFIKLSEKQMNIEDRVLQAMNGINDAMQEVESMMLAGYNGRLADIASTSQST
jgi:hypothetical protein